MRIMIKIWMVIFTIIIISCNEKNTSQNTSQAQKEVESVKVLETSPTNSTSTKMVTDSAKKEKLVNITKIVKKNDTIVSTNKPIEFTIDPNTGEVHGCPHLRLIGEDDYDFYIANKRSIRAFKDSINPILKKLVPKDKYELWYGDPENVGESAHGGLGPLWVDKTDDGKRIIVPIGYPHGGDLRAIYFFDGNMNLLNKYWLEKTMVMPFHKLNPEQTFYIVESGVRGDFYFFTRDGELYKKGNFKAITGDPGTSFGGNTISESGKFWLLSNNTDYLFEDNILILKLPNIGQAIVNEGKELLALTKASSEEEYKHSGTIAICDFKNHQLFELELKGLRLGSIFENSVTIKSLVNKKTFRYELF